MNVGKVNNHYIYHLSFHFSGESLILDYFRSVVIQEMCELGDIGMKDRPSTTMWSAVCSDVSPHECLSSVCSSSL